MVVTDPANREAFELFLVTVEPRLRRALVATYGPVDGRIAAGDALSWAWEHWTRTSSLDHPVAYLYKVGQSAIRRLGSRPFPVDGLALASDGLPEISPALWPAVAGLPMQQRTIVLLVHGYGWSQAEVAALLDIAPSTVHAHLTRALTRLRRTLEVHDGD
jgi:DNA-directed RNA polymerase specialized sigma24 family protein